MTTGLIRYNDLEIAKKHREIVQSILPPGARAVDLRRQIPGFRNNRVTKDFKAGTYMMPVGSRTVTTYSSTHDIERTTLLVIAEGVTTGQFTDLPDSMKTIERLRNLFASRRIMNIPGELYSNHSEPKYDVDDDADRRFEMLFILLTTTTREAR